MPKLTPYGAFLKGALAAHVLPRLAQDAKVPDFAGILIGAPTTNRVSQRAAIAHGVQIIVKPHLAADADLDDLADFLEAAERIAKEEEPGEDGMEANSAVPMVMPEEEADDEHPAAAKVKAICEKHGLAPEVCAELAEAVGEEDGGMDFWDRRAADAKKRLGHDESEEERERREREQSAADARSRMGRDESEEEREEREAEDRARHTMRRARDAMRRMGKDAKAEDRQRVKDAMHRARDAHRRARDARRTRAEDRRRAEDRQRAEDTISRAEAADMVKKAVDARRAEDAALYEAREYVRPWVGERKLALDSAEAVYRDALKALGDPEAATIHVSALRTVISRTPKPGETSHLAFDAAPPAGVKSAAERFPNAARVGVMG